MDKSIVMCNMQALLNFQKEVDEQNESAFNSLESELESTRNQYNKVVEQNRSFEKATIRGCDCKTIATEFRGTNR